MTYLKTRISQNRKIREFELEIEKLKDEIESQKLKSEGFDKLGTSFERLSKRHLALKFYIYYILKDDLLINHKVKLEDL